MVGWGLPLFFEDPVILCRDFPPIRYMWFPAQPEEAILLLQLCGATSSGHLRGPEKPCGTLVYQVLYPVIHSGHI